MTITEKVIGEVQRLPEADALRVLKFIETLKAGEPRPNIPSISKTESDGSNILQFFGALKDSPSFQGDLVQWQRDLRNDRP